MCGTKCPGITGPKAVKTLKGTRPVFSSEAVASAIRLLFTVIQAKISSLVASIPLCTLQVPAPFVNGKQKDI
jgi:hypothetical protein